MPSWFMATKISGGLVLPGKSGTNGRFVRDSFVCPRLLPTLSAHQVFASDLEAVEVAQDSQCDLPGVEESLCDALHVGGGHPLDAFDQFVEAEEATEVHFLAGEVRHPAGSRFEAEHQGSLQVIL